MSEIHDLQIIVRSRIPLVSIDSQEEQRVIKILIDLGEHIERPVYLWTVTDGLRMAERDDGIQVVNISASGKFEANDPKQVLHEIKSSARVGIFVLVDFHRHLEDSVTLRLLKEVLAEGTKMSRTIVLLGHKMAIPEELNRFRAPFSLDLPDKEKLSDLVIQEARV